MCIESSSFYRNTNQHVLLKNNEKFLHFQPTNIRKRDVSTEILGTEQYARLSQSGKYSLSLDQNIKIKVHEYHA